MKRLVRFRVVFRHAQGGDDSVTADIILDFFVYIFQYFIARLIIASFEYDYELISAYAIYRAVLIILAEQFTGLPYIIVAGFVT